MCGRPDAIGFDYVIGEAAHVDRGLGTSLLWVFLRDIVVPAYDGAMELFAAPDHRNTRSLRVLAKLGADRGDVVRRAAVATGASTRSSAAASTCRGYWREHDRIGISGWSYPPWRGDFYPEGLPQRRELEYAASQLTSIEINGSFYSLQRPSSWEKWRTEVPGRLRVRGQGWPVHHPHEATPGRRAAAGQLLRPGTCSPWATKLGPVLWQLPATFAYDEEVLAAFCDLLPRTTGEAAELADPPRRPALRGQALVGQVEDRPLHHALEPRHLSFATDEARRPPRRRASWRWSWPTRRGSGRASSRPSARSSTCGCTATRSSTPAATPTTPSTGGPSSCRLDRRRAGRLRLLRQRHEGLRAARRDAADRAARPPRVRLPTATVPRRY